MAIPTNDVGSNVSAHSSANLPQIDSETVMVVVVVRWPLAGAWATRQSQRTDYRHSGRNGRMGIVLDLASQHDGCYIIIVEKGCQEQFLHKQ
jgi:hypothetical protein